MQFEVWKTIKMGGGWQSFRKVLNTLHPLSKIYVVTQEAREIFPGATEIADEETKIDLVKLTVGELGFKQQHVSCNQLYERAKELGLELCPAEVGLRLRIEYQDQPDQESVFIAMEPIRDLQGWPQVFRVERAGSKMVLRTRMGDAERVWDLNDLCVFCLPHK